jgi:hypothetical protein
MHEDPEPERASDADTRLWHKIEQIYDACGPDSPEWRKVITLIAAAELAERELAYQIVNGRLRFTSPN